MSKKTPHDYGEGQRSSRVIGGQTENLVNMISQGRKHGYSSYLACR